MKRFVIVSIMLTGLSLGSCSTKTNKEEEQISNDKIAKSFEDFNGRPVYMELTEQIIDTISDDNLVQAVFDNLSQKQPTDYKKEYETVMSWNKSRQAIYMIWLLEAEVNNGGYNQFYFNSSGQFYKYLPDALKLVGAIRFADLTTRANNIYTKENQKITQHQDASVEGFSKSYEDNPLNKFDDEFYALYRTEDLYNIQVKYIRKYKSEFIDK